EGFGALGDLVFFTLAHEHAPALQLSRGLEDALKHELRRAVPLPFLFAPDDADIAPADAREHLRALVAPGPQRVIECLDGPLVEAWLARFRAAFFESESRAAFDASMAAFARTLRTWLELLDGARRLDLARAVVRFLVALPVRLLPPSFDVRQHALRLPGTTSMAQRDAALRLMAAVTDLRLFFDDARARLAHERYGDDRYDEAQVFIRMLEEELVPQRAPLEVLARTLSGAVG
ncbi:MAG TPA: hypothetical protein VGO62_01925, partial [Myxococcota bacterium]